MRGKGVPADPRRHHGASSLVTPPPACPPREPGHRAPKLSICVMFSRAFDGRLCRPYVPMLCPCLCYPHRLNRVCLHAQPGMLTGASFGSSCCAPSLLDQLSILIAWLLHVLNPNGTLRVSGTHQVPLSCAKPRADHAPACDSIDHH